MRRVPFFLMATYIIGDVHGCFTTLRRLLSIIQYDRRHDCIYLTGDLINGGPDSVAVVRWAIDEDVRTVLGNHDLHLLACAAGASPLRKKDTFSDLLTAADADDLVEWMRSRPLLIAAESFVLVHAGLLPDWTVQTALGLAAEVEKQLQSDDAAQFLRKMYGDTPVKWRPDLQSWDRLRIIVNAMTRMRMLTQDGALDLKMKKAARPGLLPWFSFPGRRSAGTRIFFGHWAALGFHMGADWVGLDSGCVWGGCLTAWRLDDSTWFQAPSEMAGRL